MEVGKCQYSIVLVFLFLTIVSSDFVLRKKRNPVAASGCDPTVCAEIGTLKLFTSPSGLPYSDALAYCSSQGGTPFIPKTLDDNNIILKFMKNISIANSYKYAFWYPKMRPSPSAEPVWNDGAANAAYYVVPVFGVEEDNLCFVIPNYKGVKINNFNCNPTIGDNPKPVCVM